MWSHRESIFRRKLEKEPLERYVPKLITYEQKETDRKSFVRECTTTYPKRYACNTYRYGVLLQQDCQEVNRQQTRQCAR